MEFVVILGLFHRPVSAGSSDTGKLQPGNLRTGNQRSSFSHLKPVTPVRVTVGFVQNHSNSLARGVLWWTTLDK